MNEIKAHVMLEMFIENELPLRYCQRCALDKNFLGFVAKLGCAHSDMEIVIEKGE